MHVCMHACMNLMFSIYFCLFTRAMHMNKGALLLMAASALVHQS